MSCLARQVSCVPRRDGRTATETRRAGLSLGRRRPESPRHARRVIWPRFQQKHAAARILGQPVREHRSGGASADYDEVPLSHRFHSHSGRVAGNRTEQHVKRVARRDASIPVDVRVVASAPAGRHKSFLGLGRMRCYAPRRSGSRSWARRAAPTSRTVARPTCTCPKARVIRRWIASSNARATRGRGAEPARRGTDQLLRAGCAGGLVDLLIPVIQRTTILNVGGQTKN